jgi:hypothetical protein
MVQFVAIVARLPSVGITALVWLPANVCPTLHCVWVEHVCTA